MYSKNPFWRIIRWAALPLSWLYAIAVYVRHFLFDIGFFASSHPGVTTICIGNLSVGGTGKTPMVEYLIALLGKEYTIAVISRGYRRISKSNIVAKTDATAHDIGDEPLQILRKYPGVNISVGNKRTEAAAALLQKYPQTNLIILDDAFQHRAIRADLNIMLTDFSHPYYKDFLLPAGNLRDIRSAASKADIIVVTKCPQDMPEQTASGIRQQMHLKPHQQVFFSTMHYPSLYDFHTMVPVSHDRLQKVMLICGLANPGELLKFLSGLYTVVHEFIYPDHHRYTRSDILHILSVYKNMRDPEICLVTTEKDAVKMEHFRDLLKYVPVYIQPVSVNFKFPEKISFDQRMNTFMQSRSGLQQ